MHYHVHPMLLRYSRERHLRDDLTKRYIEKLGNDADLKERAETYIVKVWMAKDWSKPDSLVTDETERAMRHTVLNTLSIAYMHIIEAHGVDKLSRWTEANIHSLSGWAPGDPLEAEMRNTSTGDTFYVWGSTHKSVTQSDRAAQVTDGVAENFVDIQSTLDGEAWITENDEMSFAEAKVKLAKKA